ncbi:MAG: DNA repair protein RadA [Ruminococcaceae bacterium]|nr:DNA repair protein RadA [Oscillospiraceae bacterium]
MAEKTKFVCNECGYETPKWLGKCPSCGEWNSFCEEIINKKNYDKSYAKGLKSSKPSLLSEITTSTELRHKTNITELDRVLGGGIVKGSLVLFGGDPGIGKSTLLLQICSSLSENKILYVSGEESLNQIKMRSERLNVKSDNLSVMSETSLTNILYYASEINPDIMIIDSIQTIYNDEVSSAPGSVSQVREATHSLLRYAKDNNTSVLIVGHVTKDGNIAGPRVLEHMVDCVLYFEGERHQSYRILRTVKNRFGSTNEIGVFEMKDNGLNEVKNPSKMLLSGRSENIPGSAVVCTLEGTRPVLAEIQALTSPTGFGNARRMTTGLDYNRAIMLVAILEKKLHYTMQNQDVYLNIAGGLKISEPATDLAIIMAIASNYKNFTIGNDTVFIGEVGLTGEVRSVSFVEKRVNECKKLGFKKCVIPFDNAKDIKNKDIEIYGIKNIFDAIKLFS